jgi:SAM-dependent methyltransferase
MHVIVANFSQHQVRHDNVAVFEQIMLRSQLSYNGFMQVREINHPVLGNYEQQIFDTPDEAGHTGLASQGRYGWEIPQDIPTTKLLSEVSGKTILDLGCGWGNLIVMPAMERAAKEVYACDITPQHLDNNAPMAVKTKELGYKALHKILFKEEWWQRPLLSNPSPQTLFRPIQGTLPAKESIDIMAARHVLHFGSPNAILNVFDAASLLLTPGGKFAAVNFTAYVAFIYDYDQGATLSKIIDENKRYRRGEEPLPGGYLSAKNTLGLTLSSLMHNPAFEGRDYLCFDDDTTHGLLKAWKKSRKQRGLAADLEITSSYMFTPSKIAKHNSLLAPGFESKENHYFELTKQ